jgi:dihydrolipoamide dehydrogenase
MVDKYDVICIGAGPAGYKSALKLAQSNKKVALIDKSTSQAGGTCLNEGCIPVKALIKISKLQRELKASAENYGLNIQVKEADYKKMLNYTQQVKDSLKKGLMFLFKKNGIDFIEACAELAEDKKVIIKKGNDTKEITADDIILATGSKAQEIPGFEFDGQNIISSKQALELETLPQSILILGAGAIGVEFACLFNNLGCQVHLVEIQDHILPQEDKDVALGLNSILKKNDIRIYTKAYASIVKNDKKIEAMIKKGDDEQSILVDKVLVSVGRRANIDESTLNAIGVKTDEGKIVVNNKMQTALKGVYAIGDITKYPMLAHSAYKQADVASNAILGEATEIINRQLIPNVVYSNYEVAQIGLRQQEAAEKNIDHQIKKYSMRACGRAVASNYPEGFIKVIYEAKTDKIIGAAILAHNASEMIHEFLISIKSGLTLDDIGKLVFAHPTFSEAVRDTCLG